MFAWLQSVVNYIRTDEKGQSMTEYALILALVAVVVIGVLTTMGGTIDQVFAKINTSLAGVLK